MKTYKFGTHYKHPFSAGKFSPKPKTFAQDKRIDANFVPKTTMFRTDGVKHRMKVEEFCEND